MEVGKEGDYIPIRDGHLDFHTAPVSVTRSPERLGRDDSLLIAVETVTRDIVVSLL